MFVWPNSVRGEGDRKRGWRLGDVMWPSSVRGVGERRRGSGLGDVMWPARYGGRGRGKEVGDWAMSYGLVRYRWGGDGFRLGGGDD